MATQSTNLDFESAYEVYTGKAPKVLEKVVCLRCGRPLTNEKSRLARLGPKCARKLAYETRTKSYSTITLKSQKLLLSESVQEKNIPSKQVSLFYLPNAPKKPYCRVGTLTLLAENSTIRDDRGYWKRSYCLPLLEGMMYEIFALLPEPRIFWLQVQDKQLKDVSTVIEKNNK